MEAARMTRLERAQTRPSTADECRHRCDAKNMYHP
jgi:hypothetical protein